MRISTITDRICIGGADDLRRKIIADAGITGILNVARGLNVDVGLLWNGPQFEYNKVGLRDDGGNDPAVIVAAADVLHDMSLRHAMTLCHCYEGQNRSATVIAVCLARHASMTLDDAVALVRTRHHVPKHRWGPRPETVDSVRRMVP